MISFPNTYQFCNTDLNNFALLLRKDVYPYEYMDNWERFNEKLLPDKNIFTVNLINKVLLMKIINMHKSYGKNLT